MKKTFFLRIILLGLVVILGLCNAVSAQWSPYYSIGSATGNYAFSYNQVPDNLVEANTPMPDGSTDGLAYQWQSCATPFGTFANLPAPASTQSTYVFSAPLQQTTYFRRITSMNAGNNFIYSNVIKVEVVSVNWENYNYAREHDVTVPGQTSWEAIDQLPIGQKMEVTNYKDGMGRDLEHINVGAATPASAGGQWGDVVGFTEYDANSRIDQHYLPYTVVDGSPGKFKTAPITEQAQYYSTVYNETSPYETLTYDNSPLNRIENKKDRRAHV